MSLTIDTDAAAIVEGAVKHARETMTDTGKLWTRLAITRAIESAYIRGATDATRLQIAATDKLLAANRVSEPRTEYGDDIPAALVAADARDAEELADVVGILSSAGEGVPPPTAQEVLRACKPSPALVSLLAGAATTWAKQGRIDDACAALSIALCARSAWIEGRAFT